MLQKALSDTALELMFTSFEILCFVDYLDKVNLTAYLNLPNQADQSNIDEALSRDIFYIAFSVKNLLNTKDVKEPIQWHLHSKDIGFVENYHTWLYYQQHLFVDRNDLYSLN